MLAVDAESSLRMPADRPPEPLRGCDPLIARALESFGITGDAIDLVTWIPAIELAWLGDVTDAERTRLVSLVKQRHPDLSVWSKGLLEEWLRRRPANALFRTARRALRAHLHALPPEERPSVRARIIGPCLDVADASGGLFGYRAASSQERAWLRALEAGLHIDDGQRRPDEGGVR